MKRTRFSEEQIITILKEAESGAKVRSCVGGTESRMQRNYTWRCK
jgi:hypothetical protein